jgi:hypothetical protein
MAIFNFKKWFGGPGPIDNSKNKNLLFVYRDKAGVNYYTWSDPYKVPAIRAISGERASRYSDMYMNRKTLKLLIAEMKKAGNQNDWAKVFHIIIEMENRMEFLAEESTLLELASVYYIRQDEDPDKPSDSLLEEKIIAWKKDDGARSFFVLGALLSTGRYTPQQGRNILAYLEEIKPFEKRLQSFISTTTSKSSNRTSTN